MDSIIMDYIILFALGQKLQPPNSNVPETALDRIRLMLLYPEYVVIDDSDGSLDLDET